MTVRSPRIVRIGTCSVALFLFAVLLTAGCSSGKPPGVAANFSPPTPDSAPVNTPPTSTPAKEPPPAKDSTASKVAKGVRLPVAGMAKPVSEVPKNNVVFHVGPRGGVSVPDSKARSAEEARSELKTLLSADPKMDRSKTLVVVRADRDAPQGSVVKLLRTCQAAGYTQVQLRALVKAEKEMEGQIPLNLEASGDVSFGPPTTTKPRPKPKDPAEPDDVVVAVPATDVTVMLGPSSEGQLGVIVVSTAGGETAPANLRQLGDHLNAWVKQEGKGKKPEASIAGDPALKYVHVVEVLDLCHKAGFHRIYLARPDELHDKNLMNDDIGLDPDLPTNYNIDRIEDIRVPGPVNPNDNQGILKAPDGPPLTIPPPPGFGNNGDDQVAPRLTPGGFGGRVGATREKLLKEGGGNTRSEAAVATGLKWLARHQAVDGHWSLNRCNVDAKCDCTECAGLNDDMAGTALALLPFLGAGETHRGAGKHQIYAKTVERGLKWMIAKQKVDGALSDNGYTQGLATVVLCEAYGLTSDPMLKAPAQRAVNAVVNWQGKNGGWRYRPKDDGDTSVTGWHIQALKAAQLAGLNVPNATLKGATDFLNLVASPDGSGYGYTNKNTTVSMSAAGLLCREHLGWNPRSPGLVKGVEMLRKVPPSPAFKSIYYYYYATEVIHHVGGEPWDQWNPRMRDLLVESQDQGQTADHRDQKGSWSPKGDPNAAQLGRLGSTSLSLLTLEVYYRHLPLYRRDLGPKKEDAPKP